MHWLDFNRSNATLLPQVPLTGRQTFFRPGGELFFYCVGSRCQGPNVVRPEGLGLYSIDDQNSIMATPLAEKNVGL